MTGNIEGLTFTISKKNPRRQNTHISLWSTNTMKIKRTNTYLNLYENVSRTRKSKPKRNSIDKYRKRIKKDDQK